ncbi:MAG TPA: hypothetical protein VMG30_09270 [Acidobacteriota bacterium]|nr:hypothetical protein [Acidobacteriota bacterium]
MKWSFFLVLLAVSLSTLSAQDLAQNTSSLFDDSEVKTYNLQNILVQGEVQAPVTVDLSRLPLRSVPIKELAFENGKRVFKGAYFVSGYSLYDVLNSAMIKKAPGNTFKPAVDMYAVIENAKGEKSVFSWGEIYYKNSFDILITKSIQAINPARAKIVWPLPAEPRLICGSDLLNIRYLSNPTKITVKSYFEADAAEKPKDLYAPEVKVATKAGSASFKDLGPTVQTRTYESVLYGHGMGFKEVLNVTGFRLKDVLAEYAKLAPENSGTSFIVASAKDGYRVVFSASEIMNRNDNHDYLLNDLKDAPNGGRYTLVVTPDYFADRDVRSVEKIVLVDIR